MLVFCTSAVISLTIIAASSEYRCIILLRFPCDCTLVPLSGPATNATIPQIQHPPMKQKPRAAACLARVQSIKVAIVGAAGLPASDYIYVTLIAQVVLCRRAETEGWMD